MVVRAGRGERRSTTLLTRTRGLVVTVDASARCRRFALCPRLGDSLPFAGGQLATELFERHPRVAEWSERVAKMPSVVEGVERWFNPKYLALFAEKRPEVIA